MRDKHSFSGLFENNNFDIEIPIIQRDYAQGRPGKEPETVRKRLVEDWMRLINDPGTPAMDFNFVYGTTTDDKFYPVDGQQRLTALYLLHWYLAHAVGQPDEIKNYRLDYKTRNSASEFISFLGDRLPGEQYEGKAKELYNILNYNISTKEKQNKIRDSRWFKLKWDNDPTITSCINFLCLLSEELNEKSADSLKDFWERLNNAENPAVYFTLIDDNSDKNAAETNAAKAYTRMNARGKRLTDFEVLKAMTDKIEQDCLLLGNLEYYNNKPENTLSVAYDNLYINALYGHPDAGNKLPERTRFISDESFNLFKSAYYVYCLGQKATPNDMPNGDENAPRFTDAIYNISRNNNADTDIHKYLRMLKAAFETLYNNGNTASIKSQEFLLDDKKDKTIMQRPAIAFFVFADKLWKAGNAPADNAALLQQWTAFKRILEDLKFDKWNCIDPEFKEIIGGIACGIAQYNNNVSEYFISYDFDDFENGPFKGREVLDDIRCRLRDVKVTQKLIKDGADEEILKKAADSSGRHGYLYYVSGLLNKWYNPNETVAWQTACATAKRYAEIIVSNGDIDAMLKNRDFKLCYAAASQSDEQGKLKGQDEINKCDNKHILKPENFKWNDSEYNKLDTEKSAALKILGAALKRLDDYNAPGAPSGNLLHDYTQSINTELGTDYERCWLRIAARYEKGGAYLLDGELIYDDTTKQVQSKADGIPVILRAYHDENGIYRKDIGKLNDDKVKCAYFGKNKELNIDYDETKSDGYTLDPHTKYYFTDTDGEFKTFPLGENKKNIRLKYTVKIDLSNDKDKLRGQFISFEKPGYITRYELGDNDAGRIKLKKYEAGLDTEIVKNAKKSLKGWGKLFVEIIDSPDKIKSPDVNKKNHGVWVNLYRGWDDDALKNLASYNKFYEPGTNFKPYYSDRNWTYTFTHDPLIWNEIQTGVLI